jgi:hypothetical protein
MPARRLCRRVIRRTARATPNPKDRHTPGCIRQYNPNSTRRHDVLAEHCPHCQSDVTGVAQVAVQAYGRIDIPEITSDVTKVTLYGGICPCCARRFKVAAPTGLEPGLLFGSNLHVFVLYLHPVRALDAVDAQPVRAGNQRRRARQKPPDDRAPASLQRSASGRA